MREILLGDIGPSLLLLPYGGIVYMVPPDRRPVKGAARWFSVSARCYDGTDDGMSNITIPTRMRSK
jgi:hypothetical protein